MHSQSGPHSDKGNAARGRQQVGRDDKGHAQSKYSRRPVNLPRRGQNTLMQAHHRKLCNQGGLTILIDQDVRASGECWAAASRMLMPLQPHVDTHEVGQQDGQ